MEHIKEKRTRRDSEGGKETISPIVLSTISDFFTELIYGEGSLLYLALFLGILFVISFKIREFGVIAMILSIFSMIAFVDYGNTNGFTNDLIYRVIALGVSAVIFVWLFAGALKQD